MVVTVTTPMPSVPITTRRWEFESLSRRGVLDTTLCDLSVTCDSSVIFTGYFTNKTARHYITEILLKVALKHHNPTSNKTLFQLLTYILSAGKIFRVPVTLATQ